jgi:2-polyprenyl-3-methyl-5-hydroxy-6-metoxy-1,4-benzoquinol methylase
MGMIDLIAAQSPLQRKRIDAFISRQDSDYWELAEGLVRALNRSFLLSQQDRIEAARSYNRMCMDFLREQIRFRKTGVYLRDDARVAHEEVYSQPEVMRYYMVGLLLSYVFWPNHYAMYCFLRKNLPDVSIHRYLEIAPGHGLFTVESMRRFPHLEATLVDISETSISMTRRILETFQIDPTHIRFILGDFLSVPIEGDGFDFIVMGEVLEHVDDALAFMNRARQLIRPHGKIFITTCANCPALDHIYHFHTVEEIRALIRSAGLSIVRDIALPAEAVPESEWQRELVTINYSAVLSPG